MPDWSMEIERHVAGLGLEPAREAEIVEELSQHLNDRFEELVGRGAGEDAARASVLEELGGGSLAAALRPVSPPAPPAMPLGAEGTGGGGLLRGFTRDLRHGARLLRLDPAFSIVAVLSLALGIGANTAIFQLLDAVRLRALPVPKASELVQVKIVNSHGRTGGFTAAHPDITTAIWERVRDEQQAFSSFAAWSSHKLNLSPAGEARYARVLWVSGSFFETLRLRPGLGRLTTPADDRPGCAAPGVVLSDSFWNREYGRQASVLGRKISIEGRPLEIAGVAPAGFSGVDVGRNFDMALPLCYEPVVAVEKPRSQDNMQWWLAGLGRLRPGWTIERASAHLAEISRGVFAGTVPAGYDSRDREHYLGFTLGALPVSSGWSEVREEYATPLWLLLGISALVLLIACANLANLMVARSDGRRREIAVRLALGASRARLVRQLLAESLMLAAVGTLAGAALAQLLTRVVVAYLSTERTTLFIDLHPDWRLFAFTAGLAVVTCVMFGLAPAIQATRTEPNEALKTGGRGIAGSGSRFGVRRALVVSQVSLSLVLLVGALLFVQTFRNLASLDAGFRRDRIVVAEFDFAPMRIPAGARVAFRREMVERIRTIPGVSAAASLLIVPVSGQGWNDTLRIPGLAAEKSLANFNRVGPGYFQTMGSAVLAGRDFAESDSVKSPLVAVVTQTFTKRFLGGSNPVGRSFLVPASNGSPDRNYQIVGLVKDAKYQDLREEFTPIVFVPDAQDPDPGLDMRAVIRSDLPPGEVIAAVKRAAVEKSPAAILNFREFRTIVRDGLLRERLMATLSGFFGALAAVLAMIGLYGVISYLVARRRNEIGVRIALGASRGDILRMVMREAGVLLAIGLAVGVVLSVAAASTARGFLYRLSPGDPLTLVMGAALLALVSAAASLFPARRAAALDPMEALRVE
ncbi:MAG: ABC transporter permease [Acidobacteriota bacterium]|nr:ABC transporter permease [Acidobacteriota bacterium]